MSLFSSKSEAFQAEQTSASPWSATSLNGGTTRILTPAMMLQKSKISGNVSLKGTGTTSIPGGIVYAAAGGSSLMAETTNVSDYSVHVVETTYNESPGAYTVAPTTTTTAAAPAESKFDWKLLAIGGVLFLAWKLFGPK